MGLVCIVEDEERDRGMQWDSNLRALCCGIEIARGVGEEVEKQKLERIGPIVRGESIAQNKEKRERG